MMWRVPCRPLAAGLQAVAGAQRAMAGGQGGAGGQGNRLGGELSPYLRQHKDNPVDW